MSHNPLIPKAPFAKSFGARLGGVLSLTAFFLGGLAIPASAQNLSVTRFVAEKHFTIPPDVSTAVVLQTEPEAACDLHAAGVNDPAQTMRLYGNSEGYVRFHFTPMQDVEDAYLQLDCTAAEVATTHPVHLRIAASPTEDMPAPERKVPVPAGATIRPALTEEAAQRLSDEEILAQGYPPRPDVTESPEAYAKWLQRVSRPMTILPAHAVRPSDISHGSQHPEGVTEGPESNDHWSGFVAQGSTGSFRAVEGEWAVPTVRCASESSCYSGIWAGLDGQPPSTNVVQAGTEQNSVYMAKSGVAVSYYFWTETWPQEPTANEVGSILPGDLMSVYVYVGDSNGKIDPSGDYAWFTLSVGETVICECDGKPEEVTEWTEYSVPPTKLGTSFGFTATSAEWIVERPTVKGFDGPFPELADYGTLYMSGANALPATGTTMKSYSKVENVQVLMIGNYDRPWMDNNTLSQVTADSSCSNCMIFTWKNYH